MVNYLFEECALEKLTTAIRTIEQDPPRSFPGTTHEVMTPTTDTALETPIAVVSMPEAVIPSERMIGLLRLSLITSPQKVINTSEAT